MKGDMGELVGRSVDKLWILRRTVSSLAPEDVEVASGLHDVYRLKLHLLSTKRMLNQSKVSDGSLS
jgi:hypothetical protein